MPSPSLRLRAEPMEERILHSADIAPLWLAGESADTSVQQPLLSTATDASVQRSEIVFVDASVPDAARLLTDLQAQRGAGRSIEIVIIDAGQDGVSLITATLAGRSDLSAVHVFSHGSDGMLQLGSARLDAQSLLQRAGEIAGWGNALSADADLLLYGCDVAQTAAGQQFVSDLAALTGADVAASVDVTGAASRGGNWVLEYRIGHIQADIAPGAWAQTNWQGVLATYTVTTTIDVVGSSLLPGSLRWAIQQANANPGLDTIVFAVNGTFNLSALSSGGDDNITGDFDITDSVNIIGNGTANTILNGNGSDRVLDLRAGTITISGLTIQGGRSNEGAGVRIEPAATVTMDNVIIQDNRGSGSSKGGGIYVDGALTITNSIVQRNGDNLLGNVDGGGIYVDSNARLTARNVELRDNVANDKDGGAIYHKGAGLTLENVTLAGNLAKRGGGLFIDGSASATSTLTNATVSGNTATSEGGGLWLDDWLTVDHVTVAANTAPVGGGVFDKNSGINANLRTANSIYAGNAGGNFNNAVLSLGYNLSDSFNLGLTGLGDKNNTPAGLLALANNGGFTRTHASTSTSAARDAANPSTSLTADQRGMAYFGGRADIGAFEYNPFGFAPTVSSVSNHVIDEDTALAPIGVTVGDVETAPGSLIVTATSSNQALVPDANIVLGGSGANRSIGLTPAPNANGANSGGPATITISVSDGGNITTTTFTVTVLAVNDPPVLTLPSAQSMAEDGTLILSGASAPSVSDVDAGAAPLQLTVSATNGLLSLSQTTGLSFVVGTGSGNASMTFSGTQAAINAALDGLRYRPNADFNGSAQIQFSVNDLGNSGSGGARIANGSIDVTVNADNDAPTLGLPGAQATPEPTPLAFSAASGNAITLGDVDAGGAVVQLSLSTANAFANGTLSLGSLAGLTLVGGANGSSTLVLQGTLADLNAALDTLTFSATGPGSARIDLTIDDLGNVGSGGARQTSGSISISVVDDELPVLTLSQTSISFTENGAPLQLDPGLTVSDADHLTLASATIRIGAGYSSAQDLLAFSNTGGMGNISGSFGAGVLSLSSAGQTATLAEWDAALRSVTYVNSSDAPSTATRTLTLTLNDGIADSAARQITLTVVAVNDAPVLAGSENLAPIDEDATANAGTLVSTLLAGQVSDVDGTSLVGIAVTAVDNANGAWEYTTDGGANWYTLAGVSKTGAQLLGVDANTAIRFVPNANWNGTVAAGLTFRAWDQTSGIAGDLANVSVNGGATAFSAATAQAGIVVNPRNDPPLLLQPQADQAATQDAAFSYTVPAGTFGDIDAGDTLVYSATLASGAALPSWLAFDAATRTFSGTPANADVGVITVRVSATDGSGASATDDFVLTVANVNDPPQLAIAISAPSATQDVAYSFTLPDGTFEDIDALDTLSYSATLDSGAALPAWLSFDAVMQTFSGTPANIDVGTITVRVTATDLLGLSVDATFTLTVLNVNDPPLVAAPIADQSATQDLAFSFTVPAGTFSDADAGDTLVYSATLASGAALPSWLAFDAATRTFSGTPANADVGVITVRVSATDGSGASATDDFALTVANVNDPPLVAAPIADQSATQDLAFSYTVPAGTFSDADAGDTLSYRATLASGAALPSWLTFDAATRTFSGTPANADVGTFDLRVIATDGSGASATDDFALTVANVNDPPLVAAPIADQSATQDLAFSFTVPAGTFSDADAGDTLVYSATLASGAALPSWLAFDAATRTFSGTPANADVGVITVRVSATDGSGAAAFDDFSLSVANVNDAPVLAIPIGDRGVMAGATVSFQLPSATFTDPDIGDSLSYAATLADGSALPAWLSFDASSLTFSATPGVQQTGVFVVRVTATDGAGATAQAQFAVIVAVAPTVIEAPPIIDAGTTPVPAPVEEPGEAPGPASGPTLAPTLLSPGAIGAISDAPALELALDTPLPASRANDTSDSRGARAGGSQSDAVLGDATTFDYRFVDLGSLVSLLGSDDLLRKLEELQRNLLEQGSDHRLMVASSLAATSGLSIGYVVWLIRGGVLVSSMLSALPAWQMIDPLPVVAAAGISRGGHAKAAKAANDDADVERLFDDRREPSPPTAPLPAPEARAVAKLGTKEIRT